MKASRGSDDAHPLLCELVVERSDGTLLRGAEAVRWLSAPSPGRRARVLLRSENKGRVQLYVREDRPISEPADLTAMGLTARESEVMHWVGEGKTNPEIAIILSISPCTVHHHVDKIFEKLGVGNRLQAVLAVKTWQEMH